MSDKVKILIKYGGTFIACTRHDGPGYDGGETRLVKFGLPYTYDHLLITLEEQLGLVGAAEVTLRYALPDDPCTLVGVKNDTDIENMIEEWREEAHRKLLMYISFPEGRSYDISMSRDGRPPFQSLYTSKSGSSTHADPLEGAAMLGEVMELGASSSVPGHAMLPAMMHRRFSICSKGGDTGDVCTCSHAAAAGTAAAPAGAADGHSRSSGRSHDSSPAHSAAAAALPGKLGGSGSSTSSRDGGTAGVGPAAHERMNSEEGGSGRSGVEGRLSPGSASQHGRLDMRGKSLADLQLRMEIIRPHEIEPKRFIGAGGYGEVYLADWCGASCAVKSMNTAVMLSNSSGEINRTAVEELIREANVLAGLRHPNVVWVYGLMLDADMARMSFDSTQTMDAVDLAYEKASRNCAAMLPGTIRAPALVVEYMGGGSLQAAIRERAEFLQGDVGCLRRGKLLLDTAKGMEYLHSKRIVHFDLKPGNLLLRWQDKLPLAKVADFGLSKERRSTFVSGVSAQRGTLPWAAPEILNSPDKVTEKADVYSFGVVMWGLWTFMEPHEGENYHALLLKLSLDPSVRPPIPGTPSWTKGMEPPPEPLKGWQELMERCWAVNPAQRPSFPEIVVEMEGIMAKAQRAKAVEAKGAGGTACVGVAKGERPTISRIAQAHASMRERKERERTASLNET